MPAFVYPSYDAYVALILNTAHSLITYKKNNNNRTGFISVVVTLGLLGCLINLVPQSV